MKLTYYISISPDGYTVGEPEEYKDDDAAIADVTEDLDQYSDSTELTLYRLVPVAHIEVPDDPKPTVKFLSGYVTKKKAKK